MNIEDFIDEVSEPIRWAEIKEAITHFRTFLSPDFPQFELEESVQIAEGESDRGVYLIFDRNFQLIYVGHTSDSIWSRKRKHQRKFECPIVDLIVVPNSVKCFGFALEQFLIEQFMPFFNTRGVD